MSSSGRAGQRYVYCTHGDIIDELKRIGAAPTEVPPGGTDHYLAAFLHYAGRAPTLVLAARPEDSKYTVDNVTAVTFRCYRRDKVRFLSYLEEAGLFFRVYRSLVSFEPTKILCAKIGPALWASFLYARRHGVPLVHSRHTRVKLLSGNPVRRVWFHIDRWILQRLPAVICHGPYLHAQLREIGVPEERIIQYNVDYSYLVETAGDSREKSDRRDKENELAVLFIGRIHRDKGVFDLLEAVVPLLEKNPRLRLIYAGNGPDKERLEQQVERSGVDSQISFLGHVNHDELPGVIRDAHVVVTPTRLTLTEGLCKVVPESFVLGRPVIAPDFGPFPYLIQSGKDGLLFKPEDIADLRAKIGMTIEDPGYYEKLARGAEESGKEYLVSGTDFPRALRKALGERGR